MRAHRNFTGFWLVSFACLVMSGALLWPNNVTVNAAAHPAQSTTRSPNGATACAIAVAPPSHQGSIVVTGAANIGCGGRSDAEIDAHVLSRCEDCAVVTHFTHACGAYSATANNNKSNTAIGWAVVAFEPNQDSFPALKEAREQADGKCANNGGYQCYVRLAVCDSGVYLQQPGSGATAR